MNMMLAWITWNPSREIFRIPYFDHPVTWYGVFFATGFMIGFVIMAYLYRQALIAQGRIFERDITDWALISEQTGVPADQRKQILTALNKKSTNRLELEKQYPGAIATVKEQSLWLTDKITWCIIIGTIIGARLGHVFLYDWPRYQDNLISILKVWEGGLASHGGAIGVVIAIVIFQRSIRKQYPEFTLIRLLDMVCIPTALAAFFIRIGNFVNQEILGVSTTVPWAIIFRNPIDGGPVGPRHPAQLYEAFAYLATFFILFSVWRIKGKNLRPGLISGLFFILIFGSRFLVEFIKTPLSLILDESFLQTGQYLSIPFILVGFGLVLFGRVKTKISA